MAEEIIIDDIIFLPYNPELEGKWGIQSLMKTSKGILSVRAKGEGLFISKERPYEVWYPGDEEPTGYQTADDIFNWIKIN